MVYGGPPDRAGRAPGELICCSVQPDRSSEANADAKQYLPDRALGVMRGEYQCQYQGCAAQQQPDDPISLAVSVFHGENDLWRAPVRPGARLVSNYSSFSQHIYKGIARPDSVLTHVCVWFPSGFGSSSTNLAPNIQARLSHPEIFKAKFLTVSVPIIPASLAVNFWPFFVGKVLIFGMMWCGLMAAHQLELVGCRVNESLLFIGA
jgi:hypothetical protein